MTTIIDQRLVNEAIDAYDHCCELSIGVQDAYDRWLRAPRSQAAAAFRDYTIALDWEERASLEYALIIRCLAP
jgi:hypothetical protein